MLTQAPRGTKDIFGQESRRWQEIEQAMREICDVFGIDEIGRAHV